MAQINLSGAMVVYDLLEVQIVNILRGDTFLNFISLAAPLYLLNIFLASFVIWDTSPLNYIIFVNRKGVLLNVKISAFFREVSLLRGYH